LARFAAGRTCPRATILGAYKTCSASY